MVISGMFILLFFGFSMVITVIGAVIFFMAFRKTVRFQNQVFDAVQNQLQQARRPSVSNCPHCGGAIPPDSPEINGTFVCTWCQRSF